MEPKMSQCEQDDPWEEFRAALPSKRREEAVQYLREAAAADTHSSDVEPLGFLED